MSDRNLVLFCLDPTKKDRIRNTAICNKHSIFYPIINSVLLWVCQTIKMGKEDCLTFEKKCDKQIGFI